MAISLCPLIHGALLKIACALFLLFAAISAMAQEQGKLSTRNPLDEIRDELIGVLLEAGVPFTEDQGRAIALVLEESRRIGTTFRRGNGFS